MRNLRDPIHTSTSGAQNIGAVDSATDELRLALIVVGELVHARRNGFEVAEKVIPNVKKLNEELFLKAVDEALRLHQVIEAQGMTGLQTAVHVALKSLKRAFEMGPGAEREQALKSAVEASCDAIGKKKN